MELNQMVLAMHRRAQYQFGNDVGCYSAAKMIEVALKESLSVPGFEKWTYDNNFQDGSVVVSHNNLE